MTFEDPSEGTYESPLKDASYVLECFDIEDAGEMKHGPTMKWHFEVFERESGEQVRGEDGNPFILSVLSSTKLTTGEFASKAAVMAEALLGRSILTMKGEAVAAACIGKRAQATIVHNDRGFPRVAEGSFKRLREPVPTPAPEPVEQPLFDADDPF